MLATLFVVLFLPHAAAADQDGDGVARPADCDDRDAEVFPSAPERCNGKDDNCDGVVDEAGALGEQTFWTDTDRDGHGDPARPVAACTRPIDAVRDDADCNDADPTIHPRAREIWYDGIDQTCDGNDDDADRDGFVAIEAGGDDCDDRAASVFPGAPDVPGGIDVDCSGDAARDADGDGFLPLGGGDCDDADPDVYPGAPDTPYDGIVTDCDPEDEDDVDRDGYAAAEVGGPDCDDSDAAISPLAEEIWYDGVDQDCDGDDDDQDGDNVAAVDDCDDLDPAVYPGAPGLGLDCAPIPDVDPTTELGAFRGGGGCAGAPALLLPALLAVSRRRAGAPADRRRREGSTHDGSRRSTR